MNKRECNICKSLYLPKRETSKYCSNKCRTAASRQNKPSRSNATVTQHVTQQHDSYKSKYIESLEKQVNFLTSELEKRSEEIQHLHDMQKAHAITTANLQKQLEEKQNSVLLYESKEAIRRAKANRKKQLYRWRRKLKEAATETRRKECLQKIAELEK